MDRPECDPVKLRRTYRQFRRVNRLFARWSAVYRRFIKPCLAENRSFSVCDIGAGAGDVAEYLHDSARRDGIDLAFTCVDTNESARDLNRTSNSDGACEFLHASGEVLKSMNRTFDFVISNHLVHHLSETQLLELMSDSEAICRRRVIFNDIERSMIAYLFFFAAAVPFFRQSYVVPDGLMSIRKSYTYRELCSLVNPKGWAVHRVFPYRLILTYTVRS